MPNVAVKPRLKTNRRKIAIAQPDTGEEEWQALREPIMTGWLTQGPKVAAFERTFTELHGVQHAIAVTSCTTGLHLTLAALGIGPGDEVIVPALTWTGRDISAVTPSGCISNFRAMKPGLFRSGGRAISLQPATIRRRYC